MKRLVFIFGFVAAHFSTQSYASDALFSISNCPNLGGSWQCTGTNDQGLIQILQKEHPSEHPRGVTYEFAGYSRLEASLIMADGNDRTSQPGGKRTLATCVGGMIVQQSTEISTETGEFKRVDFLILNDDQSLSTLTQKRWPGEAQMEIRKSTCTRVPQNP